MSDGGREDPRNLAPDAATGRSLDAALEACRLLLLKLEYIRIGLQQAGATADLAAIDASLRAERLARDKLLRLRRTALAVSGLRQAGAAVASSSPSQRGMPQ